MRLDPLLTASPVTGAVRPITDDLLADVYIAPRIEVDVAAAMSERAAPWSASFAAAPKDTAAGSCHRVGETGLRNTLSRSDCGQHRGFANRTRPRPSDGLAQSLA